MLAMTLLLACPIDPPREPVRITHDLATLTYDETAKLQGGRHRFRIVRDSDPDTVGGCVSFDCEGPDDSHRTVRFRKGDTADGEMAGGVVEARVIILWHPGWGPFEGFAEVRLVDAVAVE
jgi:hypothetical protein